MRWTLRDGRLAAIAALAALAAASAGCLGTAEDPPHEVEVATRYDPAHGAPDDGARGLPEGTPAVGGRLRIAVVERSSYPAYEEALASKLYDPPAPLEVEEGATLAPMADGGVQHYLLPLGMDGVGRFQVEWERPVVVRAEVDGRHPAPTDGCRRAYVPGEPSVQTLPDDARGVATFGIAC